jgi:putative transposase
VRYAWITEHGKSFAFALSEMCEVLDVSVSGYRAWKCGGIADRKRLTDAQMLALIRTIHAETKGAYGSLAWFGSCERAASPLAWPAWKD